MNRRLMAVRSDVTSQAWLRRDDSCLPSICLSLFKYIAANDGDQAAAGGSRSSGPPTG